MQQNIKQNIKLVPRKEGVGGGREEEVEKGRQGGGEMERRENKNKKIKILKKSG